MSATSYPNIKTESSYMENFLNNSFHNSYHRYQQSYHTQHHDGGEICYSEQSVHGGHSGHDEYSLFPSTYNALTGSEYHEVYPINDENDSGVTSEGTEENNDDTEDIYNDDNTKKVEAPLSAWKAKQLKLSVAGVMKRRRDANKRERKRMNGLNEAFEKLREHIPGGEKQNNKKLSKIETLQMANMYIRNLVHILQQDS